MTAQPVNEPVSPKAGRNLWAVALVILAIAIIGTIWWGMTHGEASSAWLAIAFLLAIPAGIAFWKWQHYRKRPSPDVVRPLRSPGERL